MIYAHYNKLGKVTEHVFFTLEKFTEAAVDILFVSSSPINRALDKDKLHGLVKKIIVVPNIGYDFHQWKCGIEDSTSIIGDYDKLILLNSSVIGPIFDLTQFLCRLDNLDKDLAGITSSHEGIYHLQSYCLYFSKSLFTHHYFKRYWRKLKPVADRDQVIVQYEVNLARHFIDRNFSVGAFREAEDNKNPTIVYPGKLLSEGVPFVKIQLLRDNPANLALDKYIGKLKTLYKPSLIFD